MSEEADDEHRAVQLSAVFALLTGKLEDAAAIFADGQGLQADEALLGHASEIAVLALEASTIAGAIAALLVNPESGHYA